MNNTASLSQLRRLSPSDFAALGVDNLAYVKAVEVEGVTGYAIHAADGTPLTVLTEREVAFAAARQHELEPLSVH